MVTPNGMWRKSYYLFFHFDKQKIISGTHEACRSSRNIIFNRYQGRKARRAYGGLCDSEPKRTYSLTVKTQTALVQSIQILREYSHWVPKPRLVLLLPFCLSSITMAGASYVHPHVLSFTNGIRNEASRLLQTASSKTC